MGCAESRAGDELSPDNPETTAQYWIRKNGAAIEFAIQRERGRGEHSNASGIVAMYEPRFRLTLS